MVDRATIRSNFERNRRSLELRPGHGRKTAVTRTRFTGGLSCMVEEGDRSLEVELAGHSELSSAAPNPGFMARGALGSCIVLGYAMWAAYRDVVLEEIDVEIQADYDAGGMYGVGDTPAGYSQIRCVVNVKSPAPAEEVRDLIEEADAHSPILDLFKDPTDVRFEIRVAGPEKGTSASGGADGGS